MARLEDRLKGMVDASNAAVLFASLRRDVRLLSIGMPEQRKIEAERVKEYNLALGIISKNLKIMGEIGVSAEDYEFTQLEIKKIAINNEYPDKKQIQKTIEIFRAYNKHYLHKFRETMGGW